MNDEAEYLKAETTSFNPNLSEKTKKLKSKILAYGEDIIDNEGESNTEFERRYAHRSSLELIGHKLYKIGEFLEHYIHAFVSMFIAVYVIKYTNLFYNLYFNEKINRTAFKISILFFILILIGFSYLTIYCKFKYTKEEIEKKFELIIPYCTVLFLFAFLFLTMSLWPIYSFYSIPILFSISWGFVMSGNIVNKGALGNIFCISLILLMLFSYKFIQGQGHTYK